MTKARRIEALAQYGRIITQQGWAAGEPFIERQERLHPGCNFRRWAHALGIMLRAKEILDEENGTIRA